MRVKIFFFWIEKLMCSEYFWGQFGETGAQMKATQMDAVTTGHFYNLAPSQLVFILTAVTTGHCYKWITLELNVVIHNLNFLDSK